MNRSIFGTNIPSEKAFKRAGDFILKYPASTRKQHLRRFVKLYGDKISAKKFADILVRMFDALEG